METKTTQPKISDDLKHALYCYNTYVIGSRWKELATTTETDSDSPDFKKIWFLFKNGTYECFRLNLDEHQIFINHFRDTFNNPAKHEKLKLMQDNLKKAEEQQNADKG